MDQCVKVVSSTWAPNQYAPNGGNLTVIFANSCSQAVRFAVAYHETAELENIDPGQQHKIYFAVESL
jgi:hypothetical protein